MGKINIGTATYRAYSLADLAHKRYFIYSELPVLGHLLFQSWAPFDIIMSAAIEPH